MVKIINARMIVKPEEIEKFLSLAKTMVEKSNSEAGCLVYKLYQEVGNPSGFIFYEEYENQEALDIHNSTDYFKTFIGQISEIISEKPALKIF